MAEALIPGSIRRPKDRHWFLVKQVLEMQSGPEIFRYIQSTGLAEDEKAFLVLSRLHDVVHREGTINFYEEEGADLDRVLNMFIRVNSEGTVLSYSDVLLSIATAQWSQIDAREEIHRLVDEVNSVGQGFHFSKDLVLKAGLVLSNISDIRFKVTNFNKANMQSLERNWEVISDALRLAARLLADFGFSERNLKADSVLIPLAYYLHSRRLDEAYVTGVGALQDRMKVRSWLIRSLLKPGVWGSGLDTLLTALRSSLRDSGGNFPLATVERTMARLGKALRFEEDELQDLVDSPYGNRNVFPLLSLLYPGANLRNEFQVDHIFPRKLFTKARLRRAGVREGAIDEYMEHVNGVANLQLLEGPINAQKSGMLPLEWAKRHYPNNAARAGYLAANDMHDLPSKLSDFLEFYQARRERMRARLRELLDMQPVGVADIRIARAARRA